MEYFDGFNEEIKNNTSEVLETYNTRQLLGILRRVRVEIPTHDYYIANDEYHKSLEEYYNRIKKGLSTREHIPNKVESKKLRQLMAKQKK